MFEIEFPNPRIRVKVVKLQSTILISFQSLKCSSKLELIQGICNQTSNISNVGQVAVLDKIPQKGYHTVVGVLYDINSKCAGNPDPGASNGGSNFIFRRLETDLVTFEVAGVPQNLGSREVESRFKCRSAPDFQQKIVLRSRVFLYGANLKCAGNF